MFNEILSIIATGEALTFAEVGKRSDINENILLQVLEDLLRMGYLEKRLSTEENGCETGCGGCSGCTTSFGVEPVRLHVTEKGLAKIKRDLKKID